MHNTKIEAFELEIMKHNNLKVTSTPSRETKDYNVDDIDYVVAIYDNEIVSRKMKDMLTLRPWSAFNLKYFSQSLLGSTWHILLIYLSGYYTLQVLYQLRYMTAMCQIVLFNEFDNYARSNYTDQCDDLLTGWVNHWSSQERMELTCITFFLGFYVNHDTNQQHDVLLFKKTILRYCLLSWSMTFTRFSNLEKMLKTKDDYIKKKLLTETEYLILSSSSNGGGDSDAWLDQWWIPLTWATNMVNKHFNEPPIFVPKDHKDLIGILAKYQKDLEVIIQHATHTAPVLYRQAVHLAIWSFLIMGMVSGKVLLLSFSSKYNYLGISENSRTFVLNKPLLSYHDDIPVNAGQNWAFQYEPENQHQGNLVAVLVGNLPMQQMIWYPMIFGWLKAAEIIRNPFGSKTLAGWNHKTDFCLNMVEELEVEIWKASKSLQNHNVIPMEQDIHNTVC